MTIYSAAGGLKSTAWVNIIQLAVKMLGFFIALPIVLGAVGGLDGLRAASPGADYWNIVQGGGSGWIYLAMLGPAFIVSPGLLQKLYAARDDRAVRLGVGANAWRCCSTRSCRCCSAWPAASCIRASHRPRPGAADAARPRSAAGRRHARRWPRSSRRK